MALLLAGVMVFSLTACGSSSSDDEEEIEAEDADVVLTEDPVTITFIIVLSGGNT